MKEISETSIVINNLIIIEPIMPTKAYACSSDLPEKFDKLWYIDKPDYAGQAHLQPKKKY